MNRHFKAGVRALGLHRIPRTRFLTGPYGRIDKRALGREIRKIGTFEFFTMINTGVASCEPPVLLRVGE